MFFPTDHYLMAVVSLRILRIFRVGVWVSMSVCAYVSLVCEYVCAVFVRVHVCACAACVLFPTPMCGLRGAGPYLYACVCVCVCVCVRVDIVCCGTCVRV